MTLLIHVGVVVSNVAQQVTLYVGISFSFTGLTILIVTHLAFKYKEV